MTFQQFEDSVQDGQPVELYRFTTPSRTYLYTSDANSYELSGDVYEPVPIRRKALAGTSQEDSPVLDVEISIAAQLVIDFAFSIPETSLVMEIIRSHGGPAESATIWEGAVTGISVSGRVATLRVPSRFGEGMSAPMPTVYWQTQCNHVVYNGRCGAARGSFEESAVVDTIDASGVNLTLSTVGGQPDGWFNSGEIVIDATGERRLIVAQVGTDVQINFPFRELSLGDAVTFVAGCDRTVATCFAKFNNVDNFGGHPLIPILNLFESGLDGAAKTSSNGGTGSALSAAVNQVFK